VRRGRPLLLRVARFLPVIAEHPYPVRCEGRCRASPKGGNRGNVPRRSAVARGYGDLNREML
jgi:hypothetical protein